MSTLIIILAEELNIVYALSNNRKTWALPVIENVNSAFLIIAPSSQNDGGMCPALC